VLLGMALAFLGTRTLTASPTLTNSDPAAVRGAIQKGGIVTLDFDGAVKLIDTLLIETNTTVDATGRSVSLDGGSMFRHFTVTNGATLRLINLTLINGRFVGAEGQTNQPGNPGWGGAIYNSGGTLELVGCKFISNSVLGGNGGPTTCVAGYCFRTTGGPAYGGAIYSTDGQLLATNCLFADNSCVGGRGVQAADGSYTGGGGDSFGGAIYTANGRLTLVGDTFTNNIAQAGDWSGGRAELGGGGAYGGALADVGATVVVSNSVFVANQAWGATRVTVLDPRDTGSAHGGAVFHASGAMNIVSTLFSENTVLGGLGAGRGGTTALSGDGLGGAVFNGSGALEIRNSALISNQAIGGATTGAPWVNRGGFGAGGGLYNKEGAASLLNCTLAENRAEGGAGLQSINSGTPGSALGGAIFSGGGSVSLASTTVADNSVHTDDFCIGTCPVALGSSLSITNGTMTLTNTILSCLPSQTNVSGTITDDGHNICSDASANFTLASSQNRTDPLLGPLGDYGGSTPTLSLLPGSPAIDRGDDLACPPNDQRGMARPQGLACDIGAFELAPKLTLARGQDGIVKIDYAFEAGMTIGITASTNLINWVLLGAKVSDVNGGIEFEDTGATNLSKRFYQVQIQIGQP
jgi:hypothetical protein